MNIKDYETKVVECLNAQQDEIILNRDINHAGVLIKQMFLNATHTVNLLSNKLDADLYERIEVIEAIRSFLEGKGALNIAIEGNIDENSTKLKELLNEFNVEPTVIPNWLQEQYKYNFIIMDENGYRFENDREKHEATVNFGDTDQSQKLNVIFNKILELAS